MLAFFNDFEYFLANLVHFGGIGKQKIKESKGGGSKTAAV